MPLLQYTFLLVFLFAAFHAWVGVVVVDRNHAVDLR